MNASLYRRIDDLGRIVLPKETRRKLHLDEGDMMEISVADRKVILTPYTPFSDANFIIDLCVRALSRCGEINGVVTNKKDIFMSNLKDLPKYSLLSQDTQSLIYRRTDYISDGTHPVFITEGSERMVMALFPIKKIGDLYGSFVLLGKPGDVPSEAEIEKGRLVANIISTAVSEWE